MNIPFFTCDWSDFKPKETSIFTGIPSVLECKRARCDTFFPQFSKFGGEVEFNQRLDGAIEALTNPEEYAYTAYKDNKEEQLVIYRHCKTLPFNEAVSYLYQNRDKRLYFCPDLFLSLHDTLLEFQPCCS